MNIQCHICENTEITFYKQKRSDGIWVITARCENKHIPEKAHPFYSIAQFDISKLPVLEVSQEQIKQKQPELFDLPETEAEPPLQTFLEFVEAKRNISKMFPPMKGKRS